MYLLNKFRHKTQLNKL